MRLVEKKCPKCGAGLSFNDNDVDVECEYCKASFYIKKDEKKVEKLDTEHLEQAFKLISSVSSSMTKPVIASNFVVYFISIVIIIMTIILMVGIGSAFINSNNSFDEIQKVEKYKLMYMSELSQIDNKSLETYHTESLRELNNKTFYGVTKNGAWENVGMYLFVSMNDDENILHDIYKCEFMYNDQVYVVYDAVVYKDIKIAENGGLITDFNGYDISKMTFLPNSSYYVSGYLSFEEYYNKEILSKSSEYIIKGSEGLN